MEFFVYCRDLPGTGDLRAELTEAHWSFMDRYAEAMIARGPTLTPDREDATGSVHIVDLPGPGAAHDFAYTEPNYLAGVYGEVLVRRWRNTLGRTMWQHTGQGGPGFLVLALDEPRTAVDERHLIVCGELLSADGTAATGTAALVEATDRAATAATFGGNPEDLEVHPWEPGGRR